MTKEDALTIKKWRVGGCTWRKIAANAADVWPEEGYMSGNQIEGMELCTKAASILGEDGFIHPWN